MVKNNLQILILFSLALVVLVAIPGCTRPLSDIPGKEIQDETPEATYIPYPENWTGEDSDNGFPMEEITQPVVTKTTILPVKTALATVPVTTGIASPDTGTVFCTDDKCGTLNIQITCNPRTLFKRVAILKIKSINDAAERASAIASLGNNYAEIFPDGTVTPVSLKPGRYVLVILDAGNIEVPQGGGYMTMTNVSITTGKTTKIVFREKC